MGLQDGGSRADMCAAAAQMEGMVNDLSLAKEKQQTFEVWQREEGRSLPIEMSVQVLTTGFWPQYRVRAACLPF